MNQIILPVNSRLDSFSFTVFNLSHFKNLNVNIIVHNQTWPFNKTPR